jgi:hypothetical protein
MKGRSGHEHHEGCFGEASGAASACDRDRFAAGMRRGARTWIVADGFGGGELQALPEVLADGHSERRYPPPPMAEVSEGADGGLDFQI